VQEKCRTVRSKIDRKITSSPCPDPYKLYCTTKAVKDPGKTSLVCHTGTSLTLLWIEFSFFLLSWEPTLASLHWDVTWEAHGSVICSWTRTEENGPMLALCVEKSAFAKRSFIRCFTWSVYPRTFIILFLDTFDTITRFGVFQLFAKSASLRLKRRK